MVNEPYESEMLKGLLCFADLDGSTAATEQSVAVNRFNSRAGAPAGQLL